MSRSPREDRVLCEGWRVSGHPGATQPGQSLWGDLLRALRVSSESACRQVCPSPSFLGQGQLHLLSPSSTSSPDLG